jgi:molecular chaperone GrpE (heat shock protein)
MQADQLKERINRVEECADQARQAVQAGSVPQELMQTVDSLHQQARQAKQDAGSQQQMGQDGLKQAVMQMEQTGDRAMQACRSAGNQVDPQTQQAVQRVHDEISSLKKQIQMG